jgi:uncharacterized protein (TIGR03437 family)
MRSPLGPLRISTFAVLTLIYTASAQQFPSVDGRHQDLDFVANRLPTLHPNFFAHISRESYQQAVSALDAKLSAATDAEFYVGIAQLVAMAGDGHTTLNYTSAPFRLFPLRLRWCDDGIFVSRAAGPYTEALTARLVRIADTPIGKAIDQLATVIPHENDYWLHYLLPSFIINQTILQGLRLAPDAAATPLTFQTLGGREFTLQVGTASAPLIIAVSESAGPIPLYQQNSADNYWYSYLANDRVLYFRYNSCIEMAARPFASFAADLLATLDANPVDTFVFDFRFNTGGNSGLIAPIFNGLAARFSRLTASPRFQVYDVFDEGTYSSGLMNAEDLLTSYPRSIPNPNVSVDLSTRVVSIGQPTGGKPTHYGKVAALVLPGSGIAGQCSTTLWNAPPRIPDAISLYPSIPVTLRSIDYFGRFDPVMAVVLGRGTGSPTSPSGDVITVNGASLRTDQAVAPGSYAAAFGMFSVPPDTVAVGTATTTPLFSSHAQVNFVLPGLTPAGTTMVSLLSGGQSVASGTFTVSRTGPGIFVIEPASPAQPGAILNQDGTLNTSSNPAAPGSIVQIFATGYGGQPVTAYFAERQAETLFSGSQSEFPGLWQINARVPLSVTGQVSLFVVSDLQASNGVTLWVK